MWAESSPWLGVLEPSPNTLHSPCITASESYVTSTRLGETLDTAHVPSLAQPALRICSQRTLWALYLGEVRWSAKWDVLLHLPWYRPKGTTQLTYGSLQKSLWGGRSPAAEAGLFLSVISLSGIGKSKPDDYTVNTWSCLGSGQEVLWPIKFLPVIFLLFHRVVVFHIWPFGIVQDRFYNEWLFFSPI